METSVGRQLGGGVVGRARTGRATRPLAWHVLGALGLAAGCVNLTPPWQGVEDTDGPAGAAYGGADTRRPIAGTGGAGETLDGHSEWTSPLSGSQDAQGPADEPAQLPEASRLDQNAGAIGSGGTGAVGLGNGGSVGAGPGGQGGEGGASGTASTVTGSGGIELARDGGMGGTLGQGGTSAAGDARDTGGSLGVGLVGYWAFDEGSGTVTADASGNEIAGTLLGGPSWSRDCAPAKLASGGGACLHFDGSTQSVQLADVPLANFSGPIAIAAWIKTDASKTSGGTLPYLRDIVAHGYTTDPNAEVDLRLQDNAYEAGSFDGQDHQVVSDTGAADVGAWVHIVGVFDGNAWLLYRNGRLEASQSNATGAIEVGAPWSIGAANSGHGRYFNGSIDEVRLYNRALSAAEVAELAARL
jgi:hypothetical protein